MTTFLGLVGLVVFAACVILFAASVTWTVVRLSPSKKRPTEPPAAEPS